MPVTRNNVLERKKTVSFFIFIAPWIFGFILFQLIPIMWGLYTSFTNRMAFTANLKFVGLANYIKHLTDVDILYSFGTTILYSVLHTSIAILMGFCLALMLEKKIWGRGIFRTLLYFPYMLPLIAVGWIFKIFLERDTGYLNIFLTKLGFISENIAWLSEFPLLSILSLSFWQAGWSMVIFLGGLSTIPESLYEAATIDGAGFLRKLRNIIIPLVSPFILFQFITSVVYSMQAFIQPYILNPRPIRGGALMKTIPPKETFFVMAKGYFYIITQFRFASGIALLWILFIIIMVVTFVFLKMGAFFVYSESDDR